MKWGLRHSLVAAVVTLSCLFGFITVGAAATDTKPTSLLKYSSHHGHKKIAHRHGHGSKVAKAASKQQSANNDASDETLANDALPPKVADAHAELNAGDISPKTDSSTLTAIDKTASQPRSDGVEIAASDQLNDMDRDAASDTAQPASAPAEATPALNTTAVDQPLSSAAVRQAGLRHSDAWDGASLIGKFFIGFGVMLTLASAARLMIA